LPQAVLGNILGLATRSIPRDGHGQPVVVGRKVPKADLLFVLENALRLSGVVMVKDVQGYRLIPLGAPSAPATSIRPRRAPSPATACPSCR